MRLFGWLLEVVWGGLKKCLNKRESSEKKGAENQNFKKGLKRGGCFEKGGLWSQYELCDANSWNWKLNKFFVLVGDVQKWVRPLWSRDFKIGYISRVNRLNKLFFLHVDINSGKLFQENKIGFLETPVLGFALLPYYRSTDLIFCALVVLQ